MATLLGSVLIALRDIENKLASMSKPKMPEPPPGVHRIYPRGRNYSVDALRPYLKDEQPFNGLYHHTYLEEYADKMDEIYKIECLIPRYKYWESLILLIQSIYSQLRESSECGDIDEQAYAKLLEHRDFAFKDIDSYNTTYIDMCNDLGIYAQNYICDFKDAIKKFIIQVDRESLSNTDLIN